MCLAIPGRIVEIETDSAGVRMAQVPQARCMQTKVHNQTAFLVGRVPPLGGFQFSRPLPRGVRALRPQEDSAKKQSHQIHSE
jgi:hypothetical protein